MARYRLRSAGHGVLGRVRYQATVAATAAASGVPGRPECGLVFTGVEDEGLVELIRHLGQFPQHRVDQPQGAHSDLGHRPDADRMADLGGYQVEELPGGAGRRSGQVPHLPGRAGVGAEGGQAGGDVGDVAVGVGQVRVADEVGASAR